MNLKASNAILDHYTHMRDWPAIEVMKELERIVDAAAETFESGQLVRLCDGRLGKVVRRGTYMFMVRLPGSDATEVFYPHEMEPTTAPERNDNG